nr:hypothetical protein [Tanacetum cinerariifolium]
RTSTPTRSSGHDESSSLYAKLGLTDNEEESDEDVLGTDAGVQGFTATVYSKVQENLKLMVEEQLILEELGSSSGTLPSLQHLTKDLSFGDLFFNDKPSKADNDKAIAETEAESMVSVTIQQDTYLIPPMTTPIIDLTSRPDVSVNSKHIMENLIQDNKQLEQRLDSHGARLYTLEHLDIPHQVSKSVDEVVTDAVDWAIQAPLRNRFRDLPEADMKEILHQRMWETNSYKTHEDHMQLDGTLQQIDEALDYRVKEFKVNRMNPGFNTRFWTRKDVDRSKEFMFTIQKQLKTRRIFCNLESCVGGRVRDGDYRLLKRTE